MCICFDERRYRPHPYTVVVPSEPLTSVSVNSYPVDRYYETREIPGSRRSFFSFFNPSLSKPRPFLAMAPPHVPVLRPRRPLPPQIRPQHPPINGGGGTLQGRHMNVGTRRVKR